MFDLAVTNALLSTTRAVRKRLDITRPVERSVIVDCVELSQQAPTGSNRQGWRWIAVTDTETRKIIGDYYRRSVGSYLDDAKKEAINRGAMQDARVFDSAQYLADNMHDVPVQIIPCINTAHLPKNAASHKWLALGGSIFPAIWSFQLALRARGLGSCITTLHLAYEKEISGLIGIPENFVQVALLPVAYTKGIDFKSAKRPPADHILHWNKW